tara:strand:- start:240 stop:2123 length:1884 start_codon:yes stop_codon:yes gene_type:complete
VANYSVDIAIAVKGARELKAVRAETTALTREINKLNKLANKQSKTLPNSFNTLNKVLGQAKGNLNKVALGTERYFRAIGDVIDKEERLSRAYKKQKTDFKVIEKLRRKGLEINKQNIQQIRNELAAEIRLERAKRRTGKASIGKGMAGRFSGTASSAIIGGAFPLLFGQTGAAAVGGGLGGLAGGAIGGQFGFALSILGTAIGSAIDKNDKFNQSLAALNVRFSDVSGSAQLTSKDIDAVAKRLRITKEEAFGVLGAFAQFGSGSIAKSLTEIFGSDAGAFNSVATANRQAQLANQIFESRTKIGNEVATQLLNQNLITDSATIELALAEARAKAENDIAVAQAKQITFLDRFRDFGEELLFRGGGDPTRYGEGRAEKLQKEFEEGRNQRMKDFKEALEQVRQMLGLVNEANSQFGQSGALAFSVIEDKVKDLQDEMKKLANPIYMVMTLSETMANSFEESFKGIIKGTMSVSDAFRNMLNRIADHFLDTAARMMANQLQQGLLGLLSNIFIPNPYGVKPGQSLYDIPTPSRFTDMTVGVRANGGVVNAGKSYMVGERGAEMFVPNAGGRIVPNSDLGGSTNIVVNVDASGSSVEGDEQGGRELGRVISVAIQSELIKQKRPGGLLA